MMPATASPRKGARRMSEIPSDVLRRLNDGSLQTVTLVEWLAIDTPRLLASTLPSVGLRRESARLVRAAEALRGEGVTRRVRGVGRLLHEATRDHPRRREIFLALAGHPSDMVRAWAAYMPAADERLALARRLAEARRFAADPHMSVRECAWDSFRPHLAGELKTGLRLLKPWVRDPAPGIRRCAVEATRPRGVWTGHIEPLKADPSLGIPILEPVRSDPAPYVQRAVANWINDASKTRPDWARELCARWRRESPTPQTRWIVNHALRTLRRRREKGH